MSKLLSIKQGPLDSCEQLDYAKQIVRRYAQTLETLASRLNASFHQASEALFKCQGSVIVSGMGKAGHIGQKIAATLASTGTRSHFLHPAEAVHGDLGRVHCDDVVLIFSASGETEEVVRLLPSLRELQTPVIAVTCRANSTLARQAEILLDLGEIPEAGLLGLAPSTSTVAMLAMGDALALVTSRMRGFQPADFARFHPGGSLGLKLSNVEHHMRPLAECRLARQWQTVREVFVEQSRPGRRSGAIMLTDENGRLSGLFTDSDLARIFESRRDAVLDEAIGNVMTAAPTSVQCSAKMTAAVALLAGRKISELPVTDEQGRPVGLIDITDVLGILPEEAQGSSMSAVSDQLKRPA